MPHRGQGGLGAVVGPDLGDSEVQHLDVVLVAAPFDEDILRFHVAMNDAVLVGLTQGLGNLIDDVQDPIGGKRAFGPLQVMQAPPPQHFHGQIQHPVVGFVEVVGDDGVGVAQPRTSLGLPPEPRDNRLVGEVVGVQDLERDLAARRELLAPEDGPESPFANLLTDEVTLVERSPHHVVPGT